MQTNRATMLKLTVGAVTLAISLTACQSRQPVAKLNVAIGETAVAQPAVLLLAQAEAAQVAGNPVAAVSFAELAVSADSQNAAARTALAKAYAAAGRFQSATDAYGDLVAMNPGDSNARFRGALVALANGKRRDALTQLEGLAATPALAADVGLAFALAGEADRAVDLLVKTVRSGNSTPRVRQNLALAQALAGEWAAARVTASLDLSPDAIDARVAEWAALASNKDSAWRTAMVLGVSASPGDTGRPVQLAWAVPAKAQPAAVVAPAPRPARLPIQLAKTEPLVRPAPVKIAKVEVPVAPTPVNIAKVDVPAALAPKPVVFDGVKTEKPTAKPVAPLVKVKAVAPTSGFAPKPVMAVKREIRPLPKATNGAWVVQLGSYAKAEFLPVGWQGLVHKKKALGDYKPAKSTVEVDGATYYRLSVGRFPTSAEAGEFCKSLKSEGHKCFVRKGEGLPTGPEPKRA